MKKFTLITFLFFTFNLQLIYASEGMTSKEWEVITDGPERGGDSRLSLIETKNGLLLNGEIGAIQGRNSLVGFAKARVPVSISSESIGGHFRLYSDRQIVLSIVLGKKSRKMEQEQGVVTFQKKVNLLPGTNIIQFDWDEFLPTRRGNVIPRGHKIAPEKIVSFGLQVARSAQPESVRDDPSPIEFRFILDSLFFTN